MAEYQFAPDEKVLLRANGVELPGSAMSIAREADLMLTNQNIVFPRKNMFGKVKSYSVWPLSSIRMVDGVPQCRLDTSEFMTSKLEISFQNELVSFVFHGLDDKEDIRRWINQINVLLTGNEADAESLGTSDSKFLDDTDKFVENIGDVIGTFEGAFEGALERRRAKHGPEVASRCPSCNASIKGKHGSTVTCPYCGSDVTIS